jgi:hypothetical protein
MSFVTGRRARCVSATATHLNAGLWGSRFVGDCQIGTNGETVWLRGHRVPGWVAWTRVISSVVFVPVGFAVGVVLAETMVGRWGYPPYYYLASVLLTFLLVVLGMWGAGIWTESLSSYETVSWPAPKERSGNHLSGSGVGESHRMWSTMNTLVSVTGLIQVEVPIGPGGIPRRLVLKVQGNETRSVMMVLSGAYYGTADRIHAL